VLRHLGSLTVESVRGHTIEDYRAARLKERSARGGPPSQSTVNRELGYLRAAMNRCLDAERIERVPRFKMRSEAEGVRTDWCCAETLRRILEHLAKRHQLLADVVLFAFLTGWRKTEVLHLTWKEVRLEERVITLEPLRNKSRRVRNFPISGRLVALLSRREAAKVPGCPYVFHRAGERMSDFRKAWRTATKTVGMPDLKVHGLRRSFATYQMLAGIPSAITMSLAGWASDSIYRRYSIVDQAAQVDAISRMERYLGESEKPV